MLFQSMQKIPTVSNPTGHMSMTRNQIGRIPHQCPCQLIKSQNNSVQLVPKICCHGVSIYLIGPGLYNVWCLCFYSEKNQLCEITFFKGGAQSWMHIEVFSLERSCYPLISCVLFVRYSILSHAIHGPTYQKSYLVTQRRKE